jgi:hypothetical protein
VWIFGSNFPVQFQLQSEAQFLRVARIIAGCECDTFPSNSCHHIHMAGVQPAHSEHVDLRLELPWTCHECLLHAQRLPGLRYQGRRPVMLHSGSVVFPQYLAFQVLWYKQVLAVRCNTRSVFARNALPFMSNGTQNITGWGAANQGNNGSQHGIR